jgi:hypothetical protein
MVIHRPDHYDLPHRNRQYILADENDPEAFENGVLRDGYKLRLTMTDAQRPTVTSVPLVISRQSVVDEKIRKQYDEIVAARAAADASRRKRKVRTPDPDEDDETNDAMRDHKPGFRTSDAAGAAAANLEYSRMVHDLSRQWMPEEQRAHDAQQVTADAQPPAGVSAADWARELNRREIADAWRTDAPGGAT